MPDNRRRTLSDLIRDTQTRTGESHDALAARCGVSGEALWDVGYDFPRSDFLEKMAAGLDLPLEEVQQAAAADYGAVDYPALLAVNDRSAAKNTVTITVKPADRDRVIAAIKSGAVQRHLEALRP